MSRATWQLAQVRLQRVALMFGFHKHGRADAAVEERELLEDRERELLNENGDLEKLNEQLAIESQLRIASQPTHALPPPSRS